MSPPLPHPASREDRRLLASFVRPRANVPPHTGGTPVTRRALLCPCRHFCTEKMGPSWHGRLAHAGACQNPPGLCFAPHFIFCTQLPSRKKIAPPVTFALLIGHAVVHEIPARVSSARVVMGPVDHATFFIPFVEPEEGHLVAFTEAGDPGRNVNVVGYEQRMTRRKMHEEPLMPGTVIIIWKHFENSAGTRNRDIVAAISEGGFDYSGCGRRGYGRGRG